MNLCHACSEPLDDFSPCACVFGYERVPAKPAPEGSKLPFKSNMRSMVERKLRHRALGSADVAITTKVPSR
jgi:hypothetical protein